MKSNRGKKPGKQSVDKQSDLVRLAGMYWRLMVESLALGLGIWLLVVLGPRLWISTPALLFMPAAYTAVLTFFRDPSTDRARSLSFAVLTGFILLVILSLIAPIILGEGPTPAG